MQNFCGNFLHLMRGNSLLIHDVAAHTAGIGIDWTGGEVGGVV